MLRGKNFIFVSFGLMALVLAIVGIVLPFLPTTPFLLLAAYFFHQGDPRFYDWLLNHSTFGPPIKNWEQHRSIALKHKILATIIMLIPLHYFLLIKSPPPILWAAYFIIVMSVGIFLWTRKSV